MKVRSATGFTLIELLIVVAIIGIIAAIAIPGTVWHAPSSSGAGGSDTASPSGATPIQ